MSSFHRSAHRDRSRHVSWQPKLLIFFIFLGIVLLILWNSILSIGNIPIKAGTYVINPGDTIQSLPSTFKLSISPLRYRIWTKYFAPEVQLQAGHYTIEKIESLETAFGTILKNPTNTDLSITILPGWNIYDIDASLSAKWFFKPGEFIQETSSLLPKLQAKYPFLKNAESLEGFLYPDTYRIFRNSSIENILTVLLDEFKKQIGESYTELGKKAYDRLILASIVEREERAKSSQPIVAGILLKRLEEHIALWADATVCYEYGKTQKECTPTFIGQNITKKTVYNTRNMQWLPPTPIANFTKDTWEATIHPESSPYYFYLHDMNGNIHYAKTNEEHIANKNTYLR